MLVYIFLAALLFFRIPSIYLLPFLHNSIATTQSLARVIFVCLFFYIFIFKKISLNKRKFQQISFLILILFFIQSVTVIYTNNIFSFISRYKDIVVGFTSFFLFYYFRSEYKKIFSVLVFATVFSSVYQGFMIFARLTYDLLANLFIYEKQVELSQINLSRGRIFLDAFDESIIPLIFFSYIFEKNLFKHKAYILLFSVIAFLSFLSNWRIRILMLFMSFTGSCIYLFNKSRKFTLTYSVGILTIGIIVYFIHRNILGFTFFDRLTLQDKNRDVETLLFRGTQFVQGVSEGISTSIGVGLGNYYDNLGFEEKIQIKTNNISDKEGLYAKEYIHNIFFLYLAESGLYSLVVFFILCYLFIKSDLKILRGKLLLSRALVISFWTLFVYALFNPPIPASYQILFWGLRGLLI